MDKFFHVQLVQCADMFCVCSRWGARVRSTRLLSSLWTPHQPTNAPAEPHGAGSAFNKRGWVWLASIARASARPYGAGRTGTKGQEQVAGPFKGAGAEAQALVCLGASALAPPRPPSLAPLPHPETNILSCADGLVWRAARCRAA